MTDDKSTIIMKNNSLMSGLAPPMPFCLTFSDGDKKIGSLTMDDGQLKFEGNADESAKVFFNYLVKLWRNK